MVEWIMSMEGFLALLSSPKFWIGFAFFLFAVFEGLFLGYFVRKIPKEAGRSWWSYTFEHKSKAFVLMVGTFIVSLMLIPIALIIGAFAVVVALGFGWLFLNKWYAEKYGTEQAEKVKYVERKATVKGGKKGEKNEDNNEDEGEE